MRSTLSSAKSAALLCLALGFSTTPNQEAAAASSPDLPSSCLPVGSSTCTGITATPWVYTAGPQCSATGGPFFDEQSAATSILTQEYYRPNMCDFDIGPDGPWLSGGPYTFGYCGGSINYGTLPVVSWGMETHNRRPYLVETLGPTPACNIPEDYDTWVAKSRDITCLPGMLPQTHNGKRYCAGDNRSKAYGDRCCESVGDPINYTTGNLYQRESDYVSPANPNLRFERYYNSLGQNQEGYRVNLGERWRHSFDRKVNYIESQAIYTAFVHRPDGKVFAFNFYNDAFHSADLDVVSTLERLYSMGNPIGWKYTHQEDDLVEVYDVEGKLTSITNRGGVELALSYNADDRLENVTDSFGRELNFTYTGDRLATMTDPDGEVYEYAYNGSGMLESVTYPDLTEREYLYNDPAYMGGRVCQQAASPGRHSRREWGSVCHFPLESGWDRAVCRARNRRQQGIHHLLQ